MQEHNFILAPGKAKTQAKKLFQVGKGIKGMFFGIVESYGPGIQLHYTAKKMSKCSAVISNTLRNILLSPINSPS